MTAKDYDRTVLYPLVLKAAQDMRVSTSQIEEALELQWECRWNGQSFRWECPSEGFGVSIESDKMKLDGSPGSAATFAERMSTTGVYAAAALCRWRNRKEIPPEVKL